MRKLYTADNIVEASLIKLMLKNHGIGSTVRNETLQSGIGELPFIETWPEVWIAMPWDWDLALNLVMDFKRENELADWNCPNCDELNPGTFQLCWLCKNPEDSVT